jgi:hypothetical protein
MKTFQEWSEAGYQILKGSKASWVANVAMFSEEQVVKIERPKRSYVQSSYAIRGHGGYSSGGGSCSKSEGYGDEWSLF